MTPNDYIAMPPDPSKMEKIKGGNLDRRYITKILVIQLGDLGDVLVSFPTLRALKETFPEAVVKIIVHEKAVDLLEGCQWLDGVIPVITGHDSLIRDIGRQVTFTRHIRQERFDFVVDLRTGDRSAILTFLTGARQKLSFWGLYNRWWRNRIYTHLIIPYPNRRQQHIVDFYLNPLLAYGIAPSDQQPRYHVAAHQVAAARDLLHQENINLIAPTIAFQPFSIWQYKQWPASNSIQLIAWLINTYGVQVLILGTKDQTSEAEAMTRQLSEGVYNLTGKTNLPLLAAILQQCRLSIGVDSLGGHLAAAVGTPTISLFGPGSSGEWAPRGEKTLVVQKKWGCQPCLKKGCNGTGISRCLDQLTVEDVQYQANAFIRTLLA